MRRIYVGAELMPTRVSPRQRIINRKAALEKRHGEMQRRALRDQAERLGRVGEGLFDDRHKGFSSGAYNTAELFSGKLGPPCRIGNKSLNERSELHVRRNFKFSR
jgi:hypothetical protein